MQFGIVLNTAKLSILSIMYSYVAKHLQSDLCPRNESKNQVKHYSVPTSWAPNPHPCQQTFMSSKLGIVTQLFSAAPAEFETLAYWQLGSMSIK